MVRYLLVILVVLGLASCSASKVESIRGEAARAQPRPHVSPTLHSRSLPVTDKMEILYRRESADLNQWQLCLLNLPSGKVDVLLDRKKNRKQLGAVLGDALFSPDGKLVLFAASDSKSLAGTTGNYQFGSNELLDLWLYNRRTKGIRRLTTDRQGYHYKGWSPDGKYVSAYGARGWTMPETPPTESGRPYLDLYVWNVKTGHRRLVVKDIMVNEWAPDSKRLLAIGNDCLLYVWDARTGKKHLVATDVGDAVWMRNSRGLLFVKTQADGLWYAPAGGGPVKVFLNNPTKLTQLVLSPDGKRLVYLNCDDDTRVLTLAIGESHSEVSRWPSADKPGSLPDTRWSPDNTKIAQVAGGITQDASGASTTPLAILDAKTGKIIAEKTFRNDAELMGWSRNSKTIFVANSTYVEKTGDSSNAGFLSQPVHVFAVSVGTGSRDLGTLPTAGALRDATYLDWHLVSP